MSRVERSESVEGYLEHDLEFGDTKTGEEGRREGGKKA